MMPTAPLAGISDGSRRPGILMISAGVVTAILQHPGSLIRQTIADPLLRRFVRVAMGLTAIAIIYSPWGKQSGAHLNPAVTFTAWEGLNRVDVFLYRGAISRWIGLVAKVLREAIADPAVNMLSQFLAQVGVAFLAEVIISFGDADGSVHI